MNISLHDIIRLMIDKWYWFVISAAFCLAVAYFYIASTPNIYSRTATILVKDSRKGGDVEMQAFSDLAGFQSRRNVDNEIYILQSRRLMAEVVKRLNLTTNYSVKSGLRRADLYGRSPIDVKFVNDNEKQSLSVEVTPIDTATVMLTDFQDYTTVDSELSKSENSREITGKFGDTISTPIGEIIVDRTLYLNSKYYDKPIAVRKVSNTAAVNAYRAAVKCDVANKLASIVTIGMSNSVPKRAEDVINTLINVYNEDAVLDKRQISITTSEFIKERLAVISQELVDVDRNIEDIKKDNRLIDFSTEASRSMSESTRYKAEALSLDNQITVAEFIRNYLSDSSNSGSLIPMIAAVDNQAVSSQIDKYNTTVLQREKLLDNSSANNPVIQDLDNVIASLRRSIIATLESHLTTLGLQRDAMRKEEQQANRRISTMPSHEKIILSITRQQKIKEELFLYLLNKQEETQLNAAIAEPNSRVIDTAYGNSRPVSPRRMIILFAALVLGLAIPFGLFFFIGMLDTTVRGRRDIELATTIPYLGDIPACDDKAMTKNGVVVRETGRDPLSEAFRILRSNMNFMNISSDKKIQVIHVTSSAPGAGKTFVAMNFAATIAMAGKRVLMIDLDLRRHALSKQLGMSRNRNGMTAYLSGAITDMEQIILHTDIHKNLDVILAGLQPPNPTEMLLSTRLEEMINTLRERYDYIFIDSTPAMQVADASITDRFSDMCLYVVREGVMDRNLLPDVERLYQEKRLNNMCIVLNDHTRRHGIGGNYAYGYGYGYNDHKESNYRMMIKKFIHNFMRRK